MHGVCVFLYVAVELTGIHMKRHNDSQGPCCFVYQNKDLSLCGKKRLDNPTQLQPKQVNSGNSEIGKTEKKRTDFRV